MDEAIVTECDKEACSESAYCSYAYQKDDKWILAHMGIEVGLPTPSSDGYGIWSVELNSEGDWIVTDGVRLKDVKDVRASRTVRGHSSAASCRHSYAEDNNLTWRRLQHVAASVWSCFNISMYRLYRQLSTYHPVLVHPLSTSATFVVFCFLGWHSCSNTSLRILL